MWSSWWVQTQTGSDARPLDHSVVLCCFQWFPPFVALATLDTEPCLLSRTLGHTWVTRLFRRWQVIPSEGFWSRIFAWRATTFGNLTRWIGFCMSELFRKIDEDLGGSISWNTQPNYREIFNIATELLSPFFWDLLLGCASTWRCAKEHFSPNLQPLLVL